MGSEAVAESVLPSPHKFTDTSKGITVYRGKNNIATLIRQQPDFGNRYVCIDRVVSAVLGQTSYLFSVWDSTPFEGKIQELGLHDALFHDVIKGLRAAGEKPRVKGILFDAGDHIDGLIDVVDELRGDTPDGYGLDVALTHTHRDHVASLRATKDWHEQRTGRKLRVMMGGERPAYRLEHPMQTFNPHVKYEREVQPIYEGEVDLVHLRDGQTIPLQAGNMTVEFKALLRPGHSEDDVVYVSPSEGMSIAVTGDMIFRHRRKHGKNKFNFGGFGYTDSNWQVGLHSLYRLWYDLHPDTYILPGHYTTNSRMSPVKVFDGDELMKDVRPLLWPYIQGEAQRRGVPPPKSSARVI